MRSGEARQNPCVWAAGCGGVRAAGVEPAARLRAAAARPECAAAASGARGETSLHEEVARSQG